MGAGKDAIIEYDKSDAYRRATERLTGIVSALANTVVAHDNQIDALIKIAEKHEKALADLTREWQAYRKRQ